MVDIHTHYDVEVLDGPVAGRVGAARRDHGAARVVLAVDRPRRRRRRRRPVRPRRGDPARARHRRRRPSTRRGRTATEYVEALEALPLGPNLAAFIGHSDMRTAVMGLDRATRKERQRPTEAEQAQMERLLVGGARRGLRRHVCPAAAFDKLDGDTCRSRTLPSTYARPRSGAGSTRSCARARPGAAVAARTSRTRSTSARRWSQSLGIVRRPLKTSLLSAADVKANPSSSG